MVAVVRRGHGLQRAARSPYIAEAKRKKPATTTGGPCEWRGAHSDRARDEEYARVPRAAAGPSER